MSGLQTGGMIAAGLLVAVLVGLMLLARTSWLQSDTLKKCVVLSVAVHLLLAAVAAGIGGMRPASWGTADDGRMTMLVVLADDAVDEPAAPAAEEKAAAAQPEPTALSAEPGVKAAAEAGIPAQPSGPAAAAAEQRVDISAELVPLLEADAAAESEAETDGEWLADAEDISGEQPLDAKAASGESEGPDEPGLPQPPAPYANRFGAQRQAAAAARGGSDATEKAVREGLAWLAAAQSADGRWDADLHGAGIERSIDGRDRRGAGSRSDHGVTGLALLSFLGAGNTHRTGQYADTVKKGIAFLVERQAADGSLAGDAEFFAALYCHGMATIALAETAAMTGDEALLEPLQRAIRYTLSMQNASTGGWRYAAGDTGDTSQLGWQVMALKSGQLAGAGAHPQAETRAWSFLNTVSSGRFGGRASYRPGERASVAMTAEACLCRMLLGMQAENPAATEAMDQLAQAFPDASKPNAYTWYYATLASFHVGGSQWDRWNTRMQAAVLSLQRQDPGPLRGSWDPDPVWGGHGGRVYATALSVMTLEVYYRYLPMHSQAGSRVAELPADESPATRTR